LADLALLHPAPHDLVPLYRANDTEAYAAQLRWRKRFRRSVFIMGGVAIVSSFDGLNGAFQATWAVVLRWASIVLALLGALHELLYQFNNRTLFQSWTESRAKAEYIRSEIWYYLLHFRIRDTKCEPYPADAFLHDLPTTAGEIHPSTVPAALSELRIYLQTLSVEEQWNYYLTARLRDQLNYFNRKATQLRKRLHYFKLNKKIAVCGAVAWGLLLLVDMLFVLPDVPHRVLQDLNLIGSFIGLVAIHTAYHEADDVGLLHQRYTYLANTMQALLQQHQPSNNPLAMQHCVQAVETVLRSQNNEWAIKRV
jgi:SMODS and SLOG-associating 2TM effector domain 1